MALKLLEGIRVLDLTNVLAGPFATAHLALLGADVIKIENPDGGDLARKLGAVPKLNAELMGTSFLAQNANKRSLTLNLKAAGGLEILRRLARDADVLVENFRPGVLARLGCSWETLHEQNPRLIYCAISGFGQTGPDAFKPAYDQIIQGLSGVMAINGDERLNPLRCGFPVCDTVGGLNAAFAIMGALFHRARTGEGQFIDVALLDSIMPLLGWVAANWLIGQQPPAPMGNDNFTAAPSGTFQTADGYINIAANQQDQWEKLADLVGAPELKTDERFQERDARKRHRHALSRLIEPKLKQKRTEEWVCALNRAGVPAGAIPSLQEALASPQVEHRGTLQTIHSPGIGDLRLFSLTAKFERTPGTIETPPPRLGVDTDAVLTEAGYSASEIAMFRDNGAL
jgi:crotonobetainyl-CoA:carnitine CoA-transferase CaiB-like acyl-CoA transferase